MKEASRSIKETSGLKELSETGVKFRIDKLCFPIQVHDICSAGGNGKVSPSTVISYVGHLDNFTYYQKDFDHDIERDIIVNSKKSKSFMKE
jgi:hypothetical protein